MFAESLAPLAEYFYSCCGTPALSLVKRGCWSQAVCQIKIFLLSKYLLFLLQTKLYLPKTLFLFCLAHAKSLKLRIFLLNFPEFVEQLIMVDRWRKSVAIIRSARFIQIRRIKCQRQNQILTRFHQNCSITHICFSHILHCLQHINP